MLDPLPPKDILIIEDNDDDFEATERALNSGSPLKNPIIRCRDGLEAWAYLDKLRNPALPMFQSMPGLILLDLNMPGLDGRQLVHRLKSDQHLCNIPVVVMTTSVADDDVNTCYRYGANTYIHKPVCWREFKVTIERLRQYWLQVAVLPEA